jgi:transposase
LPEAGRRGGIFLRDTDRTKPYTAFFTLSEGQEADCAHAEEVLSNVDIEDSGVLADRGYDSDQLIDYIYDRGGEAAIPPKKNRKIQRRCDWWLYKERRLVECFFQKLKNYRRIATRYDKLACTFASFVCLASIGIWLNCTV